MRRFSMRQLLPAALAVLTIGTILMSWRPRRGRRTPPPPPPPWPEPKPNASSRLPRWYRPGPRLIGEDRCSAHLTESASAPQRLRHAGVAGLFNSGTNLLHALLEANCVGNRGFVHWQVAWGKHHPLEWRGRHLEPWARSMIPNVNDSAHPAWELMLPVVVVKDPLTWMRSMCRSPYSCAFAAG